MVVVVVVVGRAKIRDDSRMAVPIVLVQRLVVVVVLAVVIVVTVRPHFQNWSWARTRHRRHCGSYREQTWLAHREVTHWR